MRSIDEDFLLSLREQEVAKLEQAKADVYYFQGRTSLIEELLKRADEENEVKDEESQNG